MQESGLIRFTTLIVGCVSSLYYAVNTDCLYDVVSHSLIAQPRQTRLQEARSLPTRPGSLALNYRTGWEMADPFTIAVSVAGLASLGIQLAQGLKKYADSALDSKGRILAISIDIGLAVQVIKTLDATLQNASRRALLTDDDKKLAKDVVSQCKDIFDEINALLPDIELVGLKKRDRIKWPIIEAKVDLFRGNLEKIKLTLQLFMSVMIYTTMSTEFVCRFVSDTPTFV
jgi:hypothetical protein